MSREQNIVRWQDGTYDYSRKCGTCSRHDCTFPIHSDRYNEIGESIYLKEDEIELESPKTYWNWMAENNPLGHHTNALGEKYYNEFYNANPDGLPEDRRHQSGTSEIQHVIIQEAFYQLTTKQQEIWQLIMRDQMSQPDVADKLGIRQQTVNDHLQAAKLKFAEYLRSQNHRVTS